ncbi:MULTISPECIES: PLP-dependent aminotransferase family protein [Pseudomonas]|jgi:DNA-binding transcriptional MocR family regulator|uniref:aminotransferase-like domain-containing protein n=1 Tax=Pseudomonas TaxID=286 RepID=UPI000654B968|nr:MULTISPECIES: PLP-dependent aminotransferase family protein [Pseudomonas]KMN16269.1 GntR family transcriptional regulator [Pseudomonas weihenstephanensis]MBJ2242833.1 PLP-dependent aminotransferase family protein [Pseudomonas sp. MF6768]MQU21139.1 aminotransferase class I/II-fold pyridoxal phosphate-dependent enzyme [Pseudomonas helleri]NMZ42843.1 PLP-dependent aminotransferase family protein [Pseudomonas proteolytica]PMX06798.1 PLP-dependent aminotransferase family protein [Pseudomonas sp.
MAVKTNIDMVSFLRESLAKGKGVKYKRLSDAIGDGILSGQFEPGRKLPPHRTLSDKLKVTIGTISRAYGELERLGLVVARVGDGTFVRKRGLDRKLDEGFRNFSEETPTFFDMSRNMYIPGSETDFLTQSLQVLAGNPSAIRDISQYTPDVGLPRYRAAGAEWLKQPDFTPTPEQVICVNGGQHGLVCSLMALLQAGDTMATEQLTYPGLITAARMLGIKLVGVETDEEGLLPSSLDAVCRNHRVSALFCTPTIQTPTAAVMSVTRREEVAKVCRDHNLLILEDDAYAVLMDDRPPPLCCFAPERTTLITSLSKTVPSGFRVGYLHAPLTLISRLSASLRSTCWMATPMSFELVTDWIENGTADLLRRQQVKEIRRRKMLVEHLLYGLEYKTHASSSHFWIPVPEPRRASEIESELKQQNYLVATAENFAVGHAVVPQFIRASVSNTSGSDQLLIEAFTTLTKSLSHTRERFSL